MNSRSNNGGVGTEQAGPLARPSRGWRRSRSEHLKEGGFSCLSATAQPSPCSASEENNGTFETQA
jgi:hypothetical protein